MNSKELYELAYNFHYSKHDFSKALETYQGVIEQFPVSPEAEYAKNQITSIQNMDESDKIIVSEKGQGAISALRFFAWLNLICGIIGAIVIWKMMWTVEVPYQYVSGTYTENNPLGIALGFASLIEGIFGCVIFLVICSMAENLIKIRKNTQKQK